MLSNKKYDIAIDLLQRQCVLYSTNKDTFQQDLNKNYLSIVIVLFSLDRFDEAKKSFQRFTAYVEALLWRDEDCSGLDVSVVRGGYSGGFETASSSFHARCAVQD